VPPCVLLEVVRADHSDDTHDPRCA
jgi:hypothetical protein